MAVQIKVVKNVTNPLLNRKEVEMTINHVNQSTPAKKVITSELSSNYSVPENQVYVYDLKTRFGSFETRAKAHLYNSIEDMKKIERQFVISRVTGETVNKMKRRARKDKRIKSYKMFGTLNRNMKKAARRNKDE